MLCWVHKLRTMKGARQYKQEGLTYVITPCSYYYTYVELTVK